MKKICFFFFLIVNFVYAQPPGEWMWIHGLNTSNSNGSFGTQGVPSPTNMPPGLYEACEWTDLNGNFWLFGGWGFNLNTYAALWKYEPATNQWTWMKGPNVLNYAGSYGVQNVSSPTNNPPCRGYGAASWVDLQGNLWMGFGSKGSGVGLSDLWKYDISINEWTWVKGPNTINQPGVYGIQGIPDPANNPGNRWECVTAWTDNAGDLWLFGGITNSDNHNDLWRFNIASNTWTWMKGSSSINQPGIYGIQNVEDPANVPGSRIAYARWKGDDGKLWFFGGSFYNTGYYNDLWRFDISTNNWTWISGTDSLNSPGTYGSKCLAAASNIPPARFESRAAWKDQHGNFWFFGGSTSTGGGLTKNDLWFYCVASNQWTWVSGDSTFSPTGSWGTINTPSPTNRPNGRTGSLGYTDNNGHLFLFGGLSGAINRHNDMWKFTIDNNCYSCNQIQQPLAVIGINDTTICSGACMNISAVVSGGTPPYSYSWTPNIGTGAGPYQACPSVTTTYLVSVTDSSGNAVIDSVNVTVNPSPAAVITPDGPLSFCQGGQVILTASGGTSYLWSNASTSPGITVLSSGTYIVTVTDNNCSATASATVIVYPLPISIITPDGPLSFCEGGQIILTASGGANYLWSDASVSPNLTVTSGGTYTVIVSDSNNCISTASESVTVNPNPTALLNPNGVLSLCNVNGIMLNASTGNGLIYEWYLNNILNPLITSSNYFATAPGNYQVKIIDATTGCYSWTQIANINQSGGGPVVTVTSSGTIGCASNTIYIGYGPQSITLTANSIPAAASYIWSTGETTQDISVSASGIYSVTVYDASGCASDQTPQSQITINTVDIRCGQHLQKVTLCHVPEGNPKNPQTICVAPSAVPAHLANHPGDCLGPCPGERLNTLSSDEITIALFPNPFNNSFILNVEGNQEEIVHLNLLDMTGRLIISDYKFFNHTELGENLSRGVYNVEVIVGEKKTVMKVVKL